MMESMECIWMIAAAGDVAGDSESANRYLRFVGRMHPLFLHFPIGLALSAAAVELFNIIFRKRSASQFALMATGFATGFAILACISGWLNADFEPSVRYDNSLWLHRWLSILAAGSLVVVFFCGLIGRTGLRVKAFKAYRWGLLMCGFLIIAAAHFGGDMVWGEDYLSKALATSSASSAPAEEDSSDSASLDTKVSSSVTTISFRKEILPIFEESCIECHGPDDDKAGLRLDTVKDIFSDDPEWWVVEPGDADKSILVERIILPKGHPDAMPPSGDSLTNEQVQKIRDWINEGAGYEPAVQEEKSPAGDEPTVPPASSTAAEDSARLKSVDALRTRGVIAMRIAQDTDDWEVNSSLIKPPFTDGDLEMLAGLTSKLIWLNLARSAVTDEGMNDVATYIRLESLRLDNTSITDAGLAPLLALEKLAVLNLYGTQITDEGLKSIASLPALRRLYCAGTQVSPEGLTEVRAAYPGIEIVGPLEPAEPDATAEK